MGTSVERVMADGESSTTVRVLTPMLPGAVGVVRLSGPDALSILGRAFRPVRVGALINASPERLCFGHLVDGDERLDDVVVAIDTAGETGPTVDVNAHGGTRVIQRIVMLFEQFGAVADEGDSPAWPAENAIQREIDNLLVRAKTRRVATWLAAQRAALPAALRSVATGLASANSNDRREASATLEAMIAGYSAARRLIDGITIVLVGPVNAGKSTLINRLAGRQRSVATDQPGTTRDWVTTDVSLAGVPAELVDTAGTHRTAESLEHEAIRRGRERAAAADVVLWVLDAGGTPPDPDEWRNLSQTRRGRLITVLNQVDKGRTIAARDLPEGLAERTVETSARTGAGVDRLVAAILGLAGLASHADDRPELLTARQQTLASDVALGYEDDPRAAGRAIIERLIGEGTPAP